MRDHPMYMRKREVKSGMRPSTLANSVYDSRPFPSMSPASTEGRARRAREPEGRGVAMMGLPQGAARAHSRA